MPKPQLEDFKRILVQLCVEIENLSIENSVYFDAIIESGTISPLKLKEQVVEAQQNSVKREETRQRFSQMWEALQDSGTAAVFEDLLNNLPPTGKPN